MNTSNPYKILEGFNIIKYWTVSGPGCLTRRFYKEKEAKYFAEEMFSAYAAGVIVGQKSMTPHLF